MVEVIKRQRYFNEALKRLLTLEQRMKLKAQAGYQTIDPCMDEPPSASENQTGLPSPPNNEHTSQEQVVQDLYSSNENIVY